MAAKKVTGLRNSRIPCRLPADTNGFSLLEIVVALAIAGILLAIAIPSFQGYVQRGQRVEAIRILMAAAACQERVRAATGYYNTSTCMDGMNGVYEFRIKPPGKEKSLQFTLTAEPRRRSSRDSCGTLSLDQSGTRRISGNQDALGACWSGR